MFSSIKSGLAVMAVAFGVGMAAPSQAATYTIDFDTLPGGGALADGSVLSNQYAAWGVNFSGFENGTAVPQPLATTAFSGEFGGAPVSGNVLENRDVNNSRADVIRIEFDSGVSGIAFDFIPFGSKGPDTRFLAYDAADNLLLDTTAGGPASSYVNFHYTGLSALSGVARLDILQPDDGWVWGLDNFSFTSGAGPTSVPEPGTLALLGLGLAGLGAMRRRKRG